MLEPFEAIRCPTCNKLLGHLSADFAGTVSFRCPRCKGSVGDPDGLPRIECPVCARWLHSGRIDAGTIRTLCKKCGLMDLPQARRPRVEPPAPRLPPPPQPRRLTSPLPRLRKQLFDSDLVAMVEDRWQASVVRVALRRTEVAVGLRFDVFNRDGFRCTYCGRTAMMGALLEADHIIPRASGGQDTLANLRTACDDCNRGKSAKPLLTDLEPTA